VFLKLTLLWQVIQALNFKTTAAAAAAAVDTAAKNITGHKTTPYTLTCSSPLQLIASSNANTNTIVNNIHSIYMVNTDSTE
jgi:hypothetical protein